MHTDNAIQLAYGIPGVFVYLAVIYAMYSMRKTLNRSFLVIFMITAVINIATWLNSWLAFRLIFEPWFAFFYVWTWEYKLLGYALINLVPQFYFWQNACVFLLVFDRYAAIYATARNTNWWNRWYGTVSVCALAVSVIVNVASKYSIEGKLFFPNDSATQGFWNNLPLLSNLVQLAFGLVIFISCCILNVLSLKQIVLIRRTTFISKEVSFFMISFCIFIAQVLNLIVMLLYSIVLATPNQIDQGSLALRFFTTFVMFYTSDLFSIGPAFYTLLLPGPIRRFYTSKFHRTFNTTQTSVVSLENSSRIGA